MLALAFPLNAPVPQGEFLGLLALVAYVPLLSWMMVAGQQESPGFVFAISLATHLLAYGIAFHWVAFHPNSITVAASIGGVMTLALLASGPLALAAWARAHASPRWLLPTWALSVLGLEHLLGVGSWALPWPVLSMTQAALPHAILARWIGGPGLTAIVLLANVLGTSAVHLLWRNVRGRFGQTDTRVDSRSRIVPGRTAAGTGANGVPWMVAATGLIGTLILPGIFLSYPEPSPKATGPPTAPSLLLIQPAIPPETWARIDTMAVVDALIRQTGQTLKERDSASTGEGIYHRRVDARSIAANRLTEASSFLQEPATAEDAPGRIVIWPETAFPPSLFAITDYSGRVQAFMQPGHTLLTGAVLPDSSSTSTYVQYRNTALWISRLDSLSDHDRPLHSNPDSKPASPLFLKEPVPGLHAAVYSKHHLVPFAERVPLVDDFSILRSLAVPSGGVAGYVPGPGPILFPPRTSHASPSPPPIIPLICFETVIGPYVRTAVSSIDRDESATIVALSHIGWWGDSAILPQYRALTRLRALETGVPIVVATVRSPAFTAHPHGDIDLHTQWMQKTDTLVRPPPSNVAPYALQARWIDTGIALLLLLSTALLNDPAKPVMKNR